MGGEKEYRKRKALRARDDYFDEWEAKPIQISPSPPEKSTHSAYAEYFT
jgi:hypothetical protein